MAYEKPDIKKEISLIMEGVLKGLLSIPFPELGEGSPETPEYMTMHWCPKCGYHKAKVKQS